MNLTLQKFKVLSFLPQGFRHNLIRSRVKVIDRLMHGLTFKIAEDETEWDQSLRLLHNYGIQERGLAARPSGRRVEKFQLLPTTANLIASMMGRVVGTLSVVRDSEMKLPLDAFCSLNDLRRPGLSLAQVTYFGMEKEFQQDPAEVLFPMVKFLWEFIERYMAVDRLVIAVDPAHADVFRALFGFEFYPAGLNVQDIQLGNRPQTVMYLDVQDVADKLEARYGGKSSEQNLGAYMLRTALAGFHFPDRRYSRIQDVVISANLMKKVFFEGQDREYLKRELSEADVALLHGLYPDAAYKEILPTPPAHLKTREFRVANKVPVRLVGRPGGGEAFIIDASDKGCRLVGLEVVSGEIIRLKAQVSLQQDSELLCQVIWTNPHEKLSGLRLVNASPVWYDFVRESRGVSSH